MKKSWGGEGEMICDALVNGKKYKGIHKNLDEALIFLETFEGKIEEGKTIINGDQVFINVMSYDGKHVEDGLYEAHKAYLDIHIVLEGKEILYNAPVHTLEEVQTFDEANDFGLYKGEKEQVCYLKPGNFAICFTTDGHMPGIKWHDESTEKIKKMVVKVKID